MAAPLAHFDEDWQDFNEFKPSSLSEDDEESEASEDRLNSNPNNNHRHAAAAHSDPPPGLRQDDDRSSSLSLSLDTSSLAGEEEEEDGGSADLCSFRSVEDLVHDFDDRLTVCFGDYGAATESIAPVKPFTEAGFLRDDGVWNALTDNYGNVMPVDWKTSHTRSLHLPILNLRPHETLEEQCLDLSDDEDLREQMDMHSIIVSCVNNDEPLFTAEQVIEEIEEMMQESPDPEDDDDSPSQSDLSLLSQDLKRSGSNTSLEDRLRQLSISELTSTLEEVEAAIRRYSEELIQALALRDELDYEKEVKNSFISLLIDVQNRQKEHRELLRKKKKIRHTTSSTTGPNGHRSSSTHVPGTYLTTVIPYEKKAGSPSVEDLQILTKILHAMRDDSEKVPSLLTDYILKVLCPT